MMHPSTASVPVAAVLIALALMAASPANGSSPAFAIPAPAAAPRPADCGAVPPIAGLDTALAYGAGDASYSSYHFARQSACKPSAVPTRRFSATLARSANCGVASHGRDRHSGACALVLLDSSAKADAMRAVSTHDAQILRSVALSGWALDHAQVRRLRLAGSDPRRAVLTWFARKAPDPRHHNASLSNVTAPNNHRARARLSAAAVALDPGGPTLAAWEAQSARIVLDQLTAEGALPLKLARQARARHHHIHAAAPLVMIAKIGSANGADLYSYRDDALHRLAALSVASFATPKTIARLSRTPQEPFVNDRGGFGAQDVAWTGFYRHRFPGRVPGATAMFPDRPLVNSEIGGDLTLLAGSVQ